METGKFLSLSEHAKSFCGYLIYIFFLEWHVLRAQKYKRGHEHIYSHKNRHINQRTWQTCIQQATAAA